MRGSLSADTLWGKNGVLVQFTCKASTGWSADPGCRFAHPGYESAIPGVDQPAPSAPDPNMIPTMTAPTKSRMTVEEFLAWAEGRPGRHELFRGAVYALSPETVGQTEIKGA